MTIETKTDRLLSAAIVLAITGLVCLLAFLLRGFTAWSVGIGIFF
ncbi:hypothetical protein [Rhodothermus bifroesti]|nr:hypothetical protein [Rhodothermus bifroesti]